MTDRKPTNPKLALGDGRVPFSTIPGPVLGELAVALAEGAMKYGRHNYRAAGGRASTYYDAAFRHLLAWWEGEEIDPDSGISHLAKAMAGLAVLRDCEMRGVMNDDRPPESTDGWLSLLTEVLAVLREKFPEPVQPYTAAEIAARVRE